MALFFFTSFTMWGHNVDNFLSLFYWGSIGPSGRRMSDPALIRPRKRETIPFPQCRAVVRSLEAVSKTRHLGKEWIWTGVTDEPSGTLPCVARGLICTCPNISFQFGPLGRTSPGHGPELKEMILGAWTLWPFFVSLARA